MIQRQAAVRRFCRLCGWRSASFRRTNMPSSDTKDCSVVLCHAARIVTQARLTIVRTRISAAP
jgi:hypothetical protein